jgi:predicted nuclease of predicted toxin-antitoxin system
LNLVCDEGIERQIVDALRAAGHTVWYVAEMRPGISDDEVLEKAAAEEATVVTNDKDFGELVFRQGRAHHGVVLLRLHGLDADKKAEIATRAISEHDSELPGAFAVVDHSRIRIRRAPQN